MSDTWLRIDEEIENYKKLNQQLAETTEKIKRLADKLDYFNDHGTWPPPSSPSTSKEGQ